MPARMKIQAVGAARKIEQIFRFDKDLWKEIQAGTKKAVEGIVQDGRSNYPSDNALTNWGKWIAKSSGRDLGFNASSARSGIKSKFRSTNRQGFRQVRGQVANSNPAGSIYLLAGSRNESGAFFNDVLNRKHGGKIGRPKDGTWPRALGPAWTKNVDEARDEIGRVVQAAIAKVNR